jgi:hypothetical protein
MDHGEILRGRGEKEIDGFVYSSKWKRGKVYDLGYLEEKWSVGRMEVFMHRRRKLGNKHKLVDRVRSNSFVIWFHAIRSWVLGGYDIAPYTNG